jgi:hypothetical protein
MNLKLNDTIDINDVINVLLVIDRKELPTSKQRKQAINDLLDKINLLEINFYPINGLLLVCGFHHEILKLLESNYIIGATVVD